MDRRQLLFGATALGLAANLNLNHPFMAQVITTTPGTRLSDREKDRLRGLVKTCTEFIGDDTEPMSETEYAADGRLMVKRYISNGSRVERVYSYDGMGRLIGVTGADGTDEFHHDDQGKKTRVRTVSPIPDQQGIALTGVDAKFDFTEEGYELKRGGSVTTSYNDDDQPIESLVRAAQGELLTNIVHNYADGRLISETLEPEAFELPGQLRDQLSEDQRGALQAKMKAFMVQFGFGNMERSYVYDKEGRVIRRLMRMGNQHQEESITYNEHGDVAGTIYSRSGSLQLPNHPDPLNLNDKSSVRYSYEYDNHGNWTEKVATMAESESSWVTRRKLTYY